MPDEEPVEDLAGRFPAGGRLEFLGGLGRAQAGEDFHREGQEFTGLGDDQVPGVERLIGHLFRFSAVELDPPDLHRA